MTHDLRTKPMTTALEIAVLVQSIPLDQGAGLIEQYAQTVAAGARLDATAEAHERMDLLFRRAMEAPLMSFPEYEADLRKVAEEMASDA